MRITTVNDELRTMLVEDNPADADMIIETLSAAGRGMFRVETVSRLSEALNHLESEDVDLVLLDLGLPDSCGLNTFHRLHEAKPRVPMIVVTGNSDVETAICAVREGAQDYFVKGQAGGDLIMRAARYAVERQRAEEALLESNRKLQATLKNLQNMQEHIVRQERLSALGEMASGIAHDFNNALMPVLGYADILLTTPGILDKRNDTVELLELLRSGAMNAAQTVNAADTMYRLKELGRPVDFSRQAPVDLCEVENRKSHTPI